MTCGSQAKVPIAIDSEGISHMLFEDKALCRVSVERIAKPRERVITCERCADIITQCKAVKLAHPSVRKQSRWRRVYSEGRP